VAQLHPVVRLVDYERLVKRRRLRVKGPLVLEEKLDGYLLVVYNGAFYTGLGRRAPNWILRALAGAGADPLPASRNRLLYIEVYGRCLSPGGFHRNDKRCYRAALVDAARPPAYAGNIEEAVLLSRTLDPLERRGIAEDTGLEHPRGAVITVDSAPRAWMLLELLEGFQDREGYVLKLYSIHGHVLPPDYGAKIRGLLEVKVKHSYRGLFAGIRATPLYSKGSRHPLQFRGKLC